MLCNNLGDGEYEKLKKLVPDLSLLKHSSHYFKLRWKLNLKKSEAFFFFYLIRSRWRRSFFLFFLSASDSATASSSSSWCRRSPPWSLLTAIPPPPRKDRSSWSPVKVPGRDSNPFFSSVHSYVCMFVRFGRGQKFHHQNRNFFIFFIFFFLANLD